MKVIFTRNHAFEQAADYLAGLCPGSGFVITGAPVPGVPEVEEGIARTGIETDYRLIRVGGQEADVGNPADIDQRSILVFRLEQILMKSRCQGAACPPSAISLRLKSATVVMPVSAAILLGSPICAVYGLIESGL